MAMLTRLQMPQTGQGRRWTVGLSVRSQCKEVDAALVAADGRGLDVAVDVAGVATAEVPRETARLFADLTSPDASGPETLAMLRSELAEVHTSLIGELLSGLGVAPSRVLAAGVHDPGLWHGDRRGSNGRLGLCDSAALAELTELNVIDAFEARDLARGGQGGPITPLAQWILLRDPSVHRVVLDLGRTVRLSYLPPTMIDNPATRILSFDVGPGTSLLDALTRRLTEGSHRFDPGGRMAVQGRRVDELIEHWLKDPYFDRPLPRWHPRGVPPERFLTDSLQMAVKSGWSIRDLLCSATHFVAEAIGKALRKRLPEDARIDQVVITGGGRQNGMLLREIARVCEIPSVRIGELGIPDEAYSPAAIAILALLHLDQVPANRTAITGTDAPRLLGRLTPGSPRNWQRLLETSAASSTAVRPLRSAL